MSGRSLKILLVASVALNIFAGAAGVALWVSKQRMSGHVAEAAKSGQRPAFADLVAQISQPEQERVFTTLKARAAEAHSDFEAARKARREAIALAQSEDFRPVEVAALLEQSRQAEMRGRGHLEASAVDVMASLSPEDRKTLSPLLSRRGQKNAGKDGSAGHCPQDHGNQPHSAEAHAAEPQDRPEAVSDQAASAPDGQP